MLINPQRAQAKFDEALVRIAKTRRARFGIVGGVVIVGLLQVAFGEQVTVLAILADLGLAAVGVVVVLLLAVRDRKRAERVFESETFHVPKRKSRS